MKKIYRFFEKYGMNVCQRLSQAIGVYPRNIRMFFIYLSFFTVVLGFILYLTFAFLFKIKDLLIINRKTVFDL
ncbi:MAG: PspC domain-containing protein [Pelagibacterales bacterium]|jgi:phage shock protein PspC (stress-responsive transcriptional regulator)|nr:PspC domain-containing protein [Pelagibacterales bacterium]